MLTSLNAASFEPQQDSFIEKRCPVASWGYHLILNCRACDIDKITDGDYLAIFVKDLVGAIGMKAYGDPILAHFAEQNPELGGYSLLQLIETSSITGHFVDINGDAYIDIFSCKDFDPQVAIDLVQDYFNPENIQSQFIYRQA